MNKDTLCRCGHRLGDHYPRGGSDCIECDVCDGNDFCEDFVEKEIERWQPIAGYSDFYSVSDQGRVLCHARLIHRIHTKPYWTAPKILAPRRGNRLGHLAVTLYDELGQRRKFWVHRLVATAFVPNPSGLPFVLHGPNGASDNRASQLRWGTQSENEMDKLRHRLARQEEMTR